MGLASTPPVVTNVQAAQRTDGTKLVDITYDVADPDSPSVSVDLKVSSDGGATYAIIPHTLTGDAGDAVTPGMGKHIVWDAGNDMPYTLGDKFKVAITAHDCPRYSGDMVTVPAGAFQMGVSSADTYQYSDETPTHAVQLSTYQISKYEVTRLEYRGFMDAGGYENPAYWSTAGWAWRSINNRLQPAYWDAGQTWGDHLPTTFTQTDRHPVIGLSYYEAEAFCKWAGGHLPTEAQWEKAARWVEATQTALVYPWGDLWDPSRCNNWNDALVVGYQTAPVGSYTSPVGDSPYGCKDMAGNAYEWCQDWYKDTAYSSPGVEGWVDPQGPASGTYRVLRGGSWGDDDELCRTSCRAFTVPTDCWQDFGFRVVR